MNTAANVIAPSRLKNIYVASGLMLGIVGTALAPAPAHAQEEQGYAGNIIGGVAGALLGSRIGNGNGQIAAAAVGGVLGSMLGGNVQAGMRQQPYQSQVYQPQVVQQHGYSYPAVQPSEAPPYGYEAYQYPPQPRYEQAYPQQRVVRYEQAYPQQRVVRYEQPTYIQQNAPVYQQPGQADQRGYTGPIVGGVAGALLASRVGKGNGKIAATALGGVVGAVVGDRIQNAPYPVQQGYAQPYQQYPQQYQTVNRVSYDNDTYAPRRYARPDQY